MLRWCCMLLQADTSALLRAIAQVCSPKCQLVLAIEVRSADTVADFFAQVTRWLNLASLFVA